MLRISFRLVTLALVFALSTAVAGNLAAAEPARLALVVGNSAYGGDATLKNPTNDASDVAAGLKKLGWKVTLATDVDRRAFNKAITTFKNDLGQSVGASALFYYAGHGIQVAGANFLVPVDAQLESVEDVKSEALSIDLVTGAMEEARVGVSLVILDACRDNPFVKKMTRSLGGTRGLSAVPNNAGAQGSAVMFSTSPGDVAQDGTARNGVFTAALLKYMAADLQIEDVFKKVSGEVRTVSGGTQKPWINSSLTANFYLTGKSGGVAPVVTPAAVVSKPVVEPAPAAEPAPSATPSASTWRIPVGVMVAASSYASTNGLTVGFTNAISPSMGWFADLDIASTDLGYSGGVYFPFGDSFRLGVGYQGISSDVFGLCAYAEFNRWRVKLGVTTYAELLDVTYALGF
ncbi:MAG: caspase family protein [Spirochaetales bacterium]